MFCPDPDRPEVAELDCQTILKDLAREVKNAERISLKVEDQTKKYFCLLWFDIVSL